MLKLRSLPIVALLIAFMFIGVSLNTANAANCDGLPITQGTLPAGNYTLEDNCVTDGTLVIDAVTVSIEGEGFTIDGNNAHIVFDVINGATLNLNSVTVTNGRSAEVGGAIHSLESTVVISNSRLVSNEARTLGGALFTSLGTAIISNSVFTDNRTYGVGNFGVAAGDGGAIHIGASTVSIVNSTIANNTSGLAGGGINIAGGNITIVNSTIANNSSIADASGIMNYLGVGYLTLQNTIISGNSPDNCTWGWGASDDRGGNFEDGNRCGLNTGSNIDPLLGAFNGTYFPLLAGSPAINAAPNCAGLTLDQVGNPRPRGGACDSGAIEVFVDEVTGQIIEITMSLNDWNGTAEEARAEAFGMDDNVYATIHMENGAWQYNAGGVPQDLIDYGVILAIDVWEQGGDQYFDNYERVCLLGAGRMIFFDATLSPRPMTEILPVDFEDGYTCGWIPNAGTVVLIDPE